MKKQIIIIVSIIAFIGLMIFFNYILQKETDKKMSQDTNTSNNIKEESDMIIEINTNNFATEVLQSDKTVLIDFYADWCGPCKLLSPIVEQVTSENENIKVVKVNVDEAPLVANEFGIMSIPTLVVVKEGKETNRAVGLVDKKTIEALIK